jgi:hypothetical protein
MTSQLVLVAVFTVIGGMGMGCATVASVRANYKVNQPYPNPNSQNGKSQPHSPQHESPPTPPDSPGLQERVLASEQHAALTLNARAAELAKVARSRLIRTVMVWLHSILY